MCIDSFLITVYSILYNNTLVPIMLLKLPITVGLINFEDKKFQGFHGYLLNLEIKYPRNFLHTHSI